MRKLFKVASEAILCAWQAVNQILNSWRFRKKIRSIYAGEIPGKLQKQRLYLVGEGVPWSAAMMCPCGCGETIHISLIPDESPSWMLKSDHNGLPTLSPSVWRTKGCRSHFFLRHGSVIWCKPNEQ